ncbi:MAG: tyrosine-type recombinase/integrase [Flavobacteriaceae bacterium]|nr:tyrosine-type recombinase/integrase [Flavobacteriaceae bacterium]
MTNSCCFHTLRICTITALLENNVPIEQVSKWLGHAEISSTKVYAKITKSRLDLTAEKLNKNY